MKYNNIFIKMQKFVTHLIFFIFLERYLFLQKFQFFYQKNFIFSHIHEYTCQVALIYLFKWRVFEWNFLLENCEN